jgi:hypothetical protein
MLEKLLYKLIGLQLPTEEELLSEAPAENANNKDANIYAAYVTYALTKDGGVDIYTEWTNDSTENARKYAELLYGINTGRLARETAKMITDYAVKNHCEAFVKNVLDYYEQLDLNQACIRPSRALPN